MNRQRTVSDEELDLLAEGELSTKQRADLFRRLEEQPWQWKNCALAILDAKAVCDSLRNCVDENRVPIAGDVRCSEQTSLSLPMIADRPSSLDAPVASRTSKSNQRSVGWVLAAAVLLALTTGSLVGYKLGGSQRAHTAATVQNLETRQHPTDRNERNDSPMQTAAQSVLHRLNVGDEKLLAVVRLNDGDKTHFVPIVSSETLADRLLRIPILPVSPQQIHLANRNGWNVLQHRQLIAIERPSAETKIVPVQMVRYRFVGRDLL